MVQDEIQDITTRWAALNLKLATIGKGGNGLNNVA